MIPAEKLASLEATAKADLPLMHLDALEILAEIRRLQAAVGIAREGLATAEYDLLRVRDADWCAEQMRLGARSGAYQVKQVLERIDEVLR